MSLPRGCLMKDSAKCVKDPTKTSMDCFKLKKSNLPKCKGFSWVSVLMIKDCGVEEDLSLAMVIWLLCTQRKQCALGDVQASVLIELCLCKTNRKWSAAVINEPTLKCAEKLCTQLEKRWRLKTDGQTRWPAMLMLPLDEQQLLLNSCFFFSSSVRSSDAPSSDSETKLQRISLKEAAKYLSPVLSLGAFRPFCRVSMRVPRMDCNCLQIGSASTSTEQTDLHDFHSLCQLMLTSNIA